MEGDNVLEKIIYLDNAATTPVRPEVVEAMLPYFTEMCGNPSSIYSLGQKSKEAVDRAREQVASLINAETKEIFFTAGGSESDNWAIKGIAEQYASKGRHIVTSKIEHHAVLNTCIHMEKQGWEVTYLDVDENGLVDPEDVRKAVRDDTVLVSVMFANNEIGTIEPVKEIAEIVHEKGAIFHTDAVQAFGQVPIDVKEMGIDLLSASGHKLNGPKGVGVLYKKKGIKITSLIDGGQQEKGKRAGTENVTGIVGLGKACEIAGKTMAERAAKETAIRDHFISRIENEIPYCRVNGDRIRRLPNNINICFRFIEGESMLIMLDAKGICGSSGSACTSGSLDPSHVLLAIGLPHEIAHGSLRLTLGEDNTMEEIDYVADELKGIIERLRSMSPLYEDFVKENG